MSDLPVLCGIGGTFAIGGKTYTWSPLTIGDMAQLEADLREAIGDRLDAIGAAKKACDLGGLREVDRRAVLEVATREHLRLRRLGPMQLIAEMPQHEGNAILLRAHLRKHHPDITLETINGMVASGVTRRVMDAIRDQAEAVLSGKDNSPPSVAGAALKRVATTTKKHRSGGSSSGISRQSGTSPTPKS